MRRVGGLVDLFDDRYLQERRLLRILIAPPRLPPAVTASLRYEFPGAHEHGEYPIGKVVVHLISAAAAAAEQHGRVRLIRECPGVFYVSYLCDYHPHVQLTLFPKLRTTDS